MMKGLRRDKPVEVVGERNYAQARKLLTDLRELARELPAGLDERGVGEQLLRDVRDQVGFDRAALYWLQDGRLSLVAVFGLRRAEWAPEDSDTRWGVAIDDGIMAAANGSLSDPATGVGAVLPLRIDGSVAGAVGIERAHGLWTDDELACIEPLLADGAVRLDAAHIFAEVRALATMEERRRLSREIHDGITQDITKLRLDLENVVDDLDEPSAEALDPIVAALDEIHADLRHSVFELRADIDADTDLLTALDAHVQQAMAGTGTIVHMTKDGSGTRLNPDVEVEVFRIAQEVIANVRKHANARNIWVEARVHPPALRLRISDDGVGRIADIRPDSFGLSIMRERAERIGARLVMRDRIGGGTLVELELT